MMNRTAPPDRPPTGYMTMRVYEVDRNGTVTADAGKVVVPPAESVEIGSPNPPCACPLHRVPGAVR